MNENSEFSEKKPRKSTAGKRKINHEWKDNETQRLIAAVEERPVLWNAGSGEYKCSRLDGWREVFDLLNIEGVDVNELKTKWLGLRATFKTNLAKLREKKSGQGTPDSQTVNWKYFKLMLFLEVNKVHQSTESVSTIKLETTQVTDESILEEISEAPQPLTPNVEVGQRRKRQRMQTAPVPEQSESSSQVSSILASAVAALQTSDANSSFCDYLLTELRTLSDTKSRELRSLLMTFVFKFMAASGIKQSEVVSVEIIDDDNTSTNNEEWLMEDIP